MALTDEDKQWLSGQFDRLKERFNTRNERSDTCDEHSDTCDEHSDTRNERSDTRNEHIRTFDLGLREHFDKRMKQLETSLLQAFAEATEAMLLEGRRYLQN